jgi:hypothetical protein
MQYVLPLYLFLLVKEPEVKWVNKIRSFFVAQEKPVTVVQESVVEQVQIKAKEPTDFEKLKTKFNPQTDLLVISEDQVNSLSENEKQWIIDLGNKVICFPDKYLINMALVRAGYGWN